MKHGIGGREIVSSYTYPLLLAVQTMNVDETHERAFYCMYGMLGRGRKL
jgi:hypothetical protein